MGLEKIPKKGTEAELELELAPARIGPIAQTILQPHLTNLATSQPGNRARRRRSTSVPGSGSCHIFQPVKGTFLVFYVGAVIYQVNENT